MGLSFYIYPVLDMYLTYIQLSTDQFIVLLNDQYLEDVAEIHSINSLIILISEIDNNIVIARIVYGGQH